MRTRKKPQQGQAMVEFAFVAILFFGLLFAIFVGALWTLDNMAATSAADTGVRIAAVASGPGANTTTSSSIVADKVKQRLGGTNGNNGEMIGTDVVVWNQPGACPSARDVQIVYPNHPTVAICAQVVASGVVQVRISGYANSYVPSIFGFYAGIPIDQYATVHTLTFST